MVRILSWNIKSFYLRHIVRFYRPYDTVEYHLDFFSLMRAVADLVGACNQTPARLNVRRVEMSRVKEHERSHLRFGRKTALKSRS